MDASGVTPTLTVVVAAITAFSGLAGSFIGGSLQARAAARTARSQAEGAAAAGRAQRFASWQMHKREVYSSLLKAIQDSINSQDAIAAGDVLASIARALVVAHKELRELLLQLEADLTPLQDPDYRRDFVEKLVIDVRQRGQDT